MSNPFTPLHMRALNMRPTMNLRLVGMTRPQKNVPYLAADVPPARAFVPYQLQQEWVSDDGTFHEWRAIEVVQL